MSAVLEIDDLTVEYRSGRRHGTFRAVEHVSLAVARHQTVGLVGESGSGKSTIARAVLGLAPVAGGHIRLLGADITHAGFGERRRHARHLQAVFQDPTSSLNPAITVGRTLAEPLLAQGVGDRQTLRSRVGDMLERVGLPGEAAGSYPAEFSGGQRQRIAIARALMAEPQLVICDEVLSALDLSVQAQIINLLEDLQTERELSYLFISHDLSVVRYLCQRTVVLYRGRVMEEGPTSRLSGAPRHPYTVALLEAAPLADPSLQRRRRAQAAATSGTAPAASAPDPSLCPFLGRCPVALERCRHEPPALLPVDGDSLVACHRQAAKTPAPPPRPPAATSPSGTARPT